ncbi:hypothetical protein OsI_12466 [Oryza sativa Indica Group]|uniref:Uncharacterized protein n=1 Tax=Oryza sativa subsp. indica TaxID=39946 RepID=B8ALN7_ORYSI|nr:hypothetical protein OsI_12466 [Oryza sativa Indica Group]
MPNEARNVATLARSSGVATLHVKEAGDAKKEEAAEWDVTALHVHRADGDRPHAAPPPAAAGRGRAESGASSTHHADDVYDRYLALLDFSDSRRRTTALYCCLCRIFGSTSENKIRSIPGKN